MRFTTANGIVLHHAVTGANSAPPLVFSNSLGTDFRIWDGLLACLGDDFRMVRYDKRGHGLSDATAAPYRIDDHVADLEGLLDQLGVTDAVLCGLSVGGMIAQGLAAKRPDLVKALVLCDTGHRIGPPDIWDSRIETVGEGGISVIADAVLERWFSKSFFADAPAELSGWRNMLVRTPAEGYMGTCAAIRDADLTESTKTIRVPTLCVCGSEDLPTPPDLVRSLADLIPGASFELIEGAAHLPCIEKPDVLSGLLRDFFEEAGLV